MPPCRRCGLARCRKSSAAAAQSLMFSLMVVLLAAAGTLPLVVWTADLATPSSAVGIERRQILLEISKSHPVKRQAAPEAQGAATCRNAASNHWACAVLPDFGAHGGSARAAFVTADERAGHCFRARASTEYALLAKPDLRCELAAMAASQRRTGFIYQGPLGHEADAARCAVSERG